MAFPTVRGEISTADPYDTPTWTDMPALIEATVTQGRSGAFDGTFQPQQMTARWKNDQRELDPSNTAATLYPYLTPQRRIRLIVNHATLGGDVDLAHGWVKDWQQDRQRFDAYAVTECRDWMGLLADRPLLSSPYAVEVAADSPVAWYRMDEVAGGSMVDSSGNSLHGYWEGNALENTVDSLIVDPGSAVAFDGSDDSARASLTLSTTVYTVEFWFATTNGNGVMLDLAVAAGLNVRRQFILVNGLFAIRDNSGFISTIADIDFADGIAHHVMLIVGDNLYLDGTVRAGSSTAFPSLPTPDRTELSVGRSLEGASRFTGVIDELSIYDSALASGRVTDHFDAATTAWDLDRTGDRVTRVLDAAGQLAADRSIDTGQRTLGPGILGGTTKDMLERIGRTEQGGIYQETDGGLRFRDRLALLTDSRSVSVQATFTDDFSALGVSTFLSEPVTFEPASIDQLRNVVTVSWAGGSEVVRDSTSEAAYGSSNQSVDTIARTAAEARDVGGWVILHNKDPHARVSSLILNPAADDTLWDPALNLRIGDRVQVSVLPQGVASRVTDDYYIDGRTTQLAHGIDVFTVTFWLAPVDDTAYFTWGGAAGTGWGEGVWS